MRFLVLIDWVPDHDYAGPVDQAEYDLEAVHENDALLVAYQWCAADGRSPVSGRVLMVLS